MLATKIVVSMSELELVAALVVAGADTDEVVIELLAIIYDGV
jgi:hypothetical protein